MLIAASCLLCRSWCSLRLLVFLHLSGGRPVASLSPFTHHGFEPHRSVAPVGHGCALRQIRVPGRDRVGAGAVLVINLRRQLPDERGGVEDAVAIDVRTDRGMLLKESGSPSGLHVRSVQGGIEPLHLVEAGIVSAAGIEMSPRQLADALGDLLSPRQRQRRRTPGRDSVERAVDRLPLAHLGDRQGPDAEPRVMFPDTDGCHEALARELPQRGAYGRT